MNLEKNPAITSAVESVMAIVGSRGSILLWTEIERASETTRYQGSWSTIVKKVRERLRKERMQVTWSEKGVGLRLLTHEETVTLVPNARQKRMFRQAGRALKELATIPISSLSMTQRRLHASQIERLTAERKALRAARRELMQASKTLPRIPQSQ